MGSVVFLFIEANLAKFSFSTPKRLKWRRKKNNRMNFKRITGFRKDTTSRK